MEQIPTQDLRIVYVAGKMVLFEIGKSIYAWASKRIANKILDGCSTLFIVNENPLTLPGKCQYQNGCDTTCNTYLAIPSTR